MMMMVGKRKLVDYKICGIQLFIGAHTFFSFLLPMMVGKGELIDYKIWNIICDGGGTTFVLFWLGSFF